MTISGSRRFRALKKGMSIRPDDRAPEWNLNEIYGREHESNIIQNLVDKQSTSTIIVKGVAGSGKSSLIESQNFEEDGWVFATGRYEVRRKQVPYSALIDVLDSLVIKWIINNKDANVCKLKRFSNLLDEDLDILETIIPKAFHDVKTWESSGKKCMLESSDTLAECAEWKAKSKARYNAINDAGAINAAFWRILSFLCEMKPVVIFLDDIQWADQASLDAIQVLSSAGNIKGFLLILSYREEEVNEGDCVSKCLDFIKEESQRVEIIHVGDLDVENTNKILASLLEHELERTLELSKVIYNKTAGNPFFVVQFVQMLRHEKFLKYNVMTLEWVWGDIEKMDQLAYVSDNVADVIVASMLKLPHACRIALQNASCLGKVIPMQVMIKYFGAKEDNVCDSLKGVRLKGLMDVFDDAVRFGILTRLDDGETFMWAHDKLQSVAYSMIPPKCLQSVHKSIGMILWEMHESNPESEWMLYMAADQLNHLTGVSDDNLSKDIARLSLQACNLSMSKAAFFPALDMIRFAARHLSNMKNPWEEAYDLSLDIYSSLAEISIRFASYEDALNAATLVIRHAKTLEDRIRAQIVFVRHKVEGGNRDYLGGIESIKQILLDYGVKFPTTIFPGQQFVENRKLKARLGGSVEKFLTLPKLNEEKIDDKRTAIILDLLSYLLEYTFTVGKLKDLNFFATTRILNISIKKGTSSDTAFAIAHFGNLLAREGNRKDSSEWCGTAIKLIDSFPPRLGSRHSTVHNWVTFGVGGPPFHKMLEPILELNRACLKYGDIQGGSMAWIAYSYAYICIGLPLAPLNSDIMSFSKEARQFGMPATVKVLFPIFRQTIQNLRILQPNPTLLKGDIFDQEKELKKFKDLGLKMTLRDINSFRLMLACIYQEWKIAEELIPALEPYLHTDKWALRRHLYLIYMGYSNIMLGEKMKGIKGQKFRLLGKKVIKILKELLKKGSTDAHPIVMMLEAIESPSKERFDEAIRATARLGLVHHAAVIHENAGQFFLNKGSKGWAEYYLSEATKLYGEWGADGKTKQMLNKYDVLQSSSLNHDFSGGHIHGRTRFTPDSLNQMREIKISSISDASTNGSTSLPITSSMTSNRTSNEEKE